MMASTKHEVYLLDTSRCLIRKLFILKYLSHTVAFDAQQLVPELQNLPIS